jgi:hypothetical protein
MFSADAVTNGRPGNHRMRAGGQKAALLAIVAFFNWATPAVASGPSDRQQSRAQSDRRQPLSSWCFAKCNELEAACKAFENKHPSCSPADICLEEKQQCEAQCRPRVNLPRPTGENT